MGLGNTKSGGYQKLATNTPGQSSYIDQMLSQALPNQQQAAQGFAQFLPGGGGGQAITDQANKNFQQTTLPSILNSFGRGSKSSSALNQALAGGAANLNTDLGSALAQMQLQAASGLGSLGSQQGQVGLSPQFAYAPQQQPFWQSALLSALGAGSQLGGSYLSRPTSNFNFTGAQQ